MQTRKKKEKKERKKGRKKKKQVAARSKVLFFFSLVLRFQGRIKPRPLPPCQNGGREKRKKEAKAAPRQTERDQMAKTRVPLVC
jgi:hypothetical protein